jgi:hypothetical protein
MQTYRFDLVITRFLGLLRKLLVTLNSIAKNQSAWHPDFAGLA